MCDILYLMCILYYVYIISYVHRVRSQEDIISYSVVYICYVQSTESDHLKSLLCKPQIRAFEL